MDEVEKILAKHGEFSKGGKNGKPMEEEKRNSLPEELQGKLRTGGFLGKDTSPGHPEKNKQRGWIKRVTSRWEAELKKKTRRTNDGFRFILSMAPRAVGDITDSKRSAERALHEIWEKTMELYRMRHGWDKAGCELAWIIGSHHDTDNMHLHVILFPTTKDGKPLKTNNNPGDRGKDLDELSAMANIAAEIYWRGHLGPQYQDPTYQQAVTLSPSIEPPLPTYDDFAGGVALIEPRNKKREEPPKLNPALIAQEMIPDAMIALRDGVPMRKPKRKGITRLRALTALKNAIGNFDWKKALLGKTKPEEVAEKFPDEAVIAKDIASELQKSTHNPTRKLGTSILKNGVEATLHLVVGFQEEPNNDTAFKSGLVMAEASQTGIKNAPDDKLAAIWKGDEAYRQSSIQTKVRAQNYRNALNQMAPDPESRLHQVLSVLIRGAERIGHVYDALREEVTCGIKKTSSGKFQKNIQPLEWTIQKGQLSRKKGEGMPWPLHYDPATVFEPLRQPEPATKETTIQPDQQKHDRSTPSRPHAGGVLKRIVRIIQPKELERRRMERLLRMQQDDPDH